ncbi:hypothetical protein DSO57_1006117 [Entomophthora muscae]|uniref:Uncharacterized protein n=1 Tax=Entomophthora muscae TaxID=34485 RepID=A0ACC2TIN9_9FUNG|nr:hypothetical protein DSO57_1006117 [Entomophthora muscae]
MLYGREATTPSILGPPLIKVDVSANPEAHFIDLTNGNCGKFDSLKLNSLVLDKVSSTRELSAACVHLLVFLA